MPRQTDSSQTGHPAASDNADASTSVLVVDDQPAGLYAKRRVLSEAGFRVIEASSGKQALLMVSEQRPALVVLDVKLPDVDGIAVCRAIKANPATASTMVLQVSAYYVSTEDQVLALDSGADGYIPGDIAPALLTAAVRALLRTRRAEEAVREREERLRLAQALHRSDEKVRALAASLFTAQEDERRRVACELHDDWGQRLAMVAIELSKLRQLSPALDGQFETIIRHVDDLSRELHGLTHTLHPSGLEHLGLDTGLRTLCEDFEQTHNLGMRYVSSVGGRSIDARTAITFYRIAQEALRNVVRHAGDARVTVTLAADEQELCLTVSDDGCGFDPDAHSDATGLGMISMQERIRLVGGRVLVTSFPGEGTTVKVRAPWPGVSKSQSNGN